MKKIVFTLLALILLGGAIFVFRGQLVPGNKGTLTVGISSPATDISPYGLNLNNATRISNMFEGLVAFDRNLKIVPALAVSWGNLDELHWEFRLRQGVLFHDGSSFGVQDVIDSLEAARASGHPQITPYISNIDSIEPLGADKILITTLSPDPLLLSKLTKLFVHKEDLLGTGPYQFVGWEEGREFRLEGFEGYWGKAPHFSKLSYKTIPGLGAREAAFSKGEVDILMGISEAQALTLPEEQRRKVFGLEVNFLMFRTDGIFKDRGAREAILSMIDPETVEDIGNHFVRRLGQFIAPGVTGFNPSLRGYEYAKSEEVRNYFGNRLEKISLEYLQTYATLAEYLSGQFRKAGFLTQLEPQSPDELLAKISSNESEFFLIGWRAEDGDAGGFFDAFIHSEGVFNQGRY
ncbi:MAG: ABC transporter substrate-binding protein, partial [Candidatus Peregrinibacteria bacterium]|nr:ABC transporter substrate-binding protein [Candidatus Peregrinibacteria bacterium]